MRACFGAGTQHRETVVGVGPDGRHQDFRPSGHRVELILMGESATMRPHCSAICPSLLCTLANLACDRPARAIRAPDGAARPVLCGQFANKPGSPYSTRSNSRRFSVPITRPFVGSAVET